MLLRARLIVNRVGKAAPKHRVSVAAKPPRLTKETRRYASDHYSTLGVSSTADASEIKKAFFEKAKKVHPDVNKGDPDAQKKFVELSAAYNVLKDKNKRAQYDTERQYGSSPFGGGFGSSSSSSSGPYSGGSPFGDYQSSSRSQQTGYNPYRQGGGNPYAHSSSQQQSGEEFMRWYQSQYGDVFREFDEFNRGNVTIIEERMPDGSIRVRIVRSDGPSRRTNRPRQSQSQQQQQQQQQARAQAAAAFNSLFGSGSGAGRIFANLFGAGFDPNAGAYQDAQSGNGIPFGSGYLDYPVVRITELNGELSFSVSASTHVGILSHRVLSGNQGDVLTCRGGNSVLAKARHYLRDGKERILIENGDSKRTATVEALSKIPEVVSQASIRQSSVAIFASIKNSLSLHYQILDESDRPSGFMSVSPFRRAITFYDMNGQVSAKALRADIEIQDIKTPTRDDWTLSISDARLVDSSVYAFAAAFSTLKSRSSGSVVPNGDVISRALSNYFKR